MSDGLTSTWEKFITYVGVQIQKWPVKGIITASTLNLFQYQGLPKLRFSYTHACIYKQDVDIYINIYMYSIIYNTIHTYNYIKSMKNIKLTKM